MKLGNPAALALASAFAMTLSACSIELGDETQGQQGKVSFQYTSLSCFFGCALDRPMLVGSKESISVRGPGVDAPDLRLSSSDPSVATFAVRRACYCERKTSDESTSITSSEGEGCDSGYTHACHNTVDATAHGAGSADCILEDGSGALIDRATVRVDEAARAAILDEDKNAGVAPSFVAKVGETLTVRAVLENARGQELLASEGVHWAVEGDALGQDGCWFCGSDVTMLRAVRPGQARVTLSAAGVASHFDVLVR
jgi:hypothetical protein